jgi:hypothetical protein
MALLGGFFVSLTLFLVFISDNPERMYLERVRGIPNR